MGPTTRVRLAWCVLGTAAFVLANLLTVRTTSRLDFGDRVELAPNVYEPRRVSLQKHYYRGWPLAIHVRGEELNDVDSEPRQLGSESSAAALALNAAFFAAATYLLASLVFVRQMDAFSWRRVVGWCACLALLFVVSTLHPRTFLRPAAEAEAR